MLHLQSVQRLASYTDSSRLNRIFFINDKTGFIVGGRRFSESVILSTNDGGATWTNNSFPVAGKGLYDITISPGGALYTIGFDGKLLHSTDTGKTWSFQQIEYYPFTGIAFTDAVHAIVVGGISFSSGMRHYIDTFGNLTRRDSFAYQFNRIIMTTPQTGYLCGYGIMQKTTDAGTTWNFQAVDKDDFTDMDIHGDELWMCGYNGGIYHTTDGGAHWERLRNGNDITLPRYYLYCIAFKDSRHGWAAGEGGKLIYTDDAGRHWSEYDSFTGNTIRDMVIRPDGSLLLAGDNGSIFRVVPK